MKLDNFDFNPVEDKELGFDDYAMDLLAAPVRGLEGLARSAYDLGDFLAFDALPDLDEERIFGKSATMPGMILEGITQFAVPFGAIGAGVKAAGAAARVGKLGGVAGKTAKALTKTRDKLSFKGDLAVGAAADVIAFDGQEERLSNLIQQFPELQNPVTEYLAASPDDSEALGRAKNAIEGLILGGVIGTVGAVATPMFRSFIAGLDAIKTRNTELDKGATRQDATITAVLQHQDATKDIRLDEEFAFERRKDADEFDELFREVGGEPEEIPQVDLRTINWDTIEIDEIAAASPSMTREEAEAIQAGGILDFQDETAKTIVKHYKMPGGSFKTIILDRNNPSRIYDATNYVDMLADKGAPRVRLADLDQKFGGINESMKKDFYQKTLVDEVGTRMDSDAPMTARQVLEDIQGRTGGLLNDYDPIVKKLLALGEDTGIDVKLELKSKAKDLPKVLKRGSFYDPEKRRIVIDDEALSVKTNPVYNVLHEATHAVTVDNAVKHYDRSAFNKVDVNNIAGRAAVVDAALKQTDVPKPVAEMLRMFKKVDAMRDEIADKGKIIGADGKPDLYWIKNPQEFMSFAFSDPQVQQALKGIQYTPKMTMWQKFVNTVKSLFGRGVSTDLMDNIVSRVGEISEMKLPTQRGRGVSMMPEAFHGTPHIFKPKPDAPFGEFMKSKIGTGEGAQAFGHGFYVAEAEGVARHYYIGQTFRHLLNDIEKASGGLNYLLSRDEIGDIRDLIDEVIETGGATDFIKRSYDRGASYVDTDRLNFKLEKRKTDFLKAVREDDYLGFDNPIDGILHAIEDAQGKGPGNYDLSPATRKAAKELGRLYKIDVAPSEDKFLPLDKLLMQMPKEMQKLIRFAFKEISEVDPDFPKHILTDEEFDLMTGQQVYETLVNSKVIGSPEAASDFLSEIGIPGNRYLQGGKARKTGEGKYNYVVFSEKDLKVTDTVEFSPTGREARGEFKADEELDEWMVPPDEDEVPFVGIEIDPKTKEFLVAGDSVNVGNTLEQLTTNASTPEVRNLAKTLRELISDPEDLNVPIKYDPETQPEVFSGSYNIAGDVVQLYKEASEETLVHEILHGVTARKLAGHIRPGLSPKEEFPPIDHILAKELVNDSDVPKPVRELADSFLKAYDHPTISFNLYQMWNLDEFLVGALSNEDFQKLLSKIPAEDNRNLFQKLVDAIANLIGIKSDGTLLNKVIRDSAEIISSSRKELTGPGFPKASTGDRSMYSRGARGEFKADDTFIDDIVKDIDVSSFMVGGKQSISGVLKNLTKLKLPEGLQTGELIAIQEKLADKIFKEASKNPKLTEELLDEGVVNEMADAVGADGKFFDGIIKAAKKDKVQLFRIASRMKTLEHMLTANGAEILDIAEKYKAGKSKLGEEELEILEARLKGALEQQLIIQSNHSSIASGFGKGLKARQMGVKVGLSPNELSNSKLRQEYLQRRGGMTTDQMVESILLASSGKGDAMWNAIISMNKLIRGSEGGKMMNMVEEYYKNSLMSAPSSLVINFMGGGIAAAIKNFERYVGGWMGMPTEARQAVVNSWSQAKQYQDIGRFMLKAWKSGDQFIGESGNAFVEQTGKGAMSSAITGQNIESSINKAREFAGKGTAELSDATKGFIDHFGNLIRIPNRFNTTVDQMYKFMEYRMRAHANLWLRATDMGLTDPKDIAEYIDKSLNVLLTRSNRTFSKANLIREAEAQFKNLPPVEREKAVYDYVSNAEKEAVQKARELGLVKQEGEEFQALQELARDWVDPNISAAEDVTFTKELGPFMQKVQDLVKGSRIGFIVAPFVRTPTNILKFSFARTLAPAAALKDAAMMAISPTYSKRIEALSNGQPGLENARKTLLEQMHAVNPDGSPDVIARAEARGRLATGTLLNTALASTVYYLGDRVNGGGPKDFKQRQAWQAAGNMPYSVKVGDTWVSYQRLDPIATMIGVYADFKDLMEDGKMHSIDDSDFEKFVAASTLVMTRNATNKSYLTGIDKFFSMIFDPDSTSAGETIGSMIGGFVPNILNKGQSITGDQELKEIRGMADAILKRFPGTNLDLKRNPLGEPVVQEYFEGVAGVLNPANPMMWGSAKDDPVLLEMANIGHGFSSPSVKLEGIIDLTDFQGSNKRSAYDRWLELQGKVKINNRTLRQTLLKLINSKQYQALSTETYSGLPSPRVDFIRRVLSRFRSKAKMEMLKEFPEVKQQLDVVKKAKKAGRPQDVLELLQ